MALPQAHFEQLFADSDDPWEFRSRWYELRKRDLTLACLPAPRFGAIFEPGCANGELSLALAERCDRLLCSDGVPRAAALARQRLAAHPHVEVREGWMPADWPDEKFDLIVLSEFGYYLVPEAWVALAERARASLAEGGAVLACHWRPPIGGCELDGDQVHAALDRHMGLPRLFSLVDADFRLELWSADKRSVGQRVGLR